MLSTRKHSLFCIEQVLKCFSIIFLDKCKQLENKEREVIHITTKYEWLLKETERMDNEMLSLKPKNETLKKSFNNAMNQNDLEISEAISQDEKLHTLESDKCAISQALNRMD